MGIQFMHIKLPDNTKVYVFGSYLYSDQPNDLDILVVYDPLVIHPSKAYEEFKPMFICLEYLIGLKVDSTLLTVAELEQSEFLGITNAIELRNYVNPISKLFL